MPTKIPKAKSKAEETFARQLEHYKIPFVREYMFHAKRKWRYDFYLPEHNILIECQGGVFSNGAHTRGEGYTEDCEKMNEAVKMGFRVFWFTSDHVMKWKAVEFIRGVVKNV